MSYRHPSDPIRYYAPEENARLAALDEDGERFITGVRQCDPDPIVHAHAPVVFVTAAVHMRNHETWLQPWQLAEGDGRRGSVIKRARNEDGTHCRRMWQWEARNECHGEINT